MNTVLRSSKNFLNISWNTSPVIGYLKLLDFVLNGNELQLHFLFYQTVCLASADCESIFTHILAICGLLFANVNVNQEFEMLNDKCGDYRVLCKIIMINFKGNEVGLN